MTAQDPSRTPARPGSVPTNASTSAASGASGAQGQHAVTPPHAPHVPSGRPPPVASLSTVSGVPPAATPTPASASGSGTASAAPTSAPAKAAPAKSLAGKSLKPKAKITIIRRPASSTGAKTSSAASSATTSGAPSRQQSSTSTGFSATSGAAARSTSSTSASPPQPSLPVVSVAPSAGRSVARAPPQQPTANAAPSSSSTAAGFLQSYATAAAANANTNANNHTLPPVSTSSSSAQRSAANANGAAAASNGHGATAAGSPLATRSLYGNAASTTYGAAGQGSHFAGSPTQYPPPAHGGAAGSAFSGATPADASRPAGHGSNAVSLDYLNVRPPAAHAAVHVPRTTAANTTPHTTATVPAADGGTYDDLYLGGIGSGATGGATHSHTHHSGGAAGALIPVDNHSGGGGAGAGSTSTGALYHDYGTGAARTTAGAGGVAGPAGLGYGGGGAGGAGGTGGGGGTGGATHQASTSTPGGSCIGQCGFFGSEDRLGFCTKCFTPIRDDMYLKAIVGAKRGLIPPLESFAAAGGDLTRRVQDTDRLTLAKVAQFVNTGQGLCEIAAAGACGNDAALMWLLERAPTFEDIGVAEREGIRRTTLPSLLSPEMARNANGLNEDNGAPLKATTTATEDRSASPPAVTGAGGTVSGAVSKSLSGDGGYDEEEGHIDSQMLAENVRLELLSTREERGDGLIVLDTTVLVPNNFPDPVSIATTSSSAATASTKKKTPSSSKSKSAPPSGVEMAAAIAASMPRSSMLTQRPIGASFALPTSIRASIEVVLKAFLEQDAMRGDVDVSMSFFPLVPGCSSAAPLYTVADLNCLLHGAFLTIAGVRDGIFASDDQGGAHSQSRTVLRDALYRSLVQCSPLQMVVADGTTLDKADAVTEKTKQREKEAKALEKEALALEKEAKEAKKAKEEEDAATAAAIAAVAAATGEAPPPAVAATPPPPADEDDEVKSNVTEPARRVNDNDDDDASPAVEPSATRSLDDDEDAAAPPAAAAASPPDANKTNDVMVKDDDEASKDAQAAAKKQTSVVSADVMSAIESGAVSPAPSPAAGPLKPIAPPVFESEGIRRLKELQGDVLRGKESLDGGHVFTLANVLRRPVIVYARESIEGAFRQNLSVPFRVSGIYLPLMWKPEECSPDPLALSFSRGHYTGLVGFVEPWAEDTVRWPLCDETFQPLPLHFFPDACGSSLLARLRTAEGYFTRVLETRIGSRLAEVATEYLSKGKDIPQEVLDSNPAAPPPGSPGGTHFKTGHTPLELACLNAYMTPKASTFTGSTTEFFEVAATGAATAVDTIASGGPTRGASRPNSAEAAGNDKKRLRSGVTSPNHNDDDDEDAGAAPKSEPLSSAPIVAASATLSARNEDLTDRRIEADLSEGVAMSVVPVDGPDGNGRVFSVATAVQRHVGMCVTATDPAAPLSVKYASAVVVAIEERLAQEGLAP